MRPMSATDDASLEELLGTLPGEQRDRLEALIAKLGDSGISSEEAYGALLERRLHLLAIDRTIGGEERLSANDIAAEVELDPEVLVALLRALGLVVGDKDETNLTDADLEAARRVKTLIDVGVPARMLEESARVMAMALAQVAASNRMLIAGLLPERTEQEEGSVVEQLEAAEELDAIANGLMPLVAPALDHIYRIQVREQLRHAAIGAVGDLRAPGVEPTAVAFADLVGFTKLGERLPPEEYGEITQQFSGLAADAAEGPVRLVKMIGDAAMFTCPDPAVLADAVLGLLEAVEEREDEFPSVRAGLSWGDVVARGGDVYGRPVNLASRLTGAARPSSVLVAAEDLTPLEERFHLSDAGHKRLKGIDGRVHIFRCRRPNGGERSENPPAVG
jgi:adenylate cyclase